MNELADLDVTSSDGIWIAHIDGEVDLSNADALASAIESVLGRDGYGLVVDLTDVEYLDSAGVRLLFRIARASGRAGWPLRLAIPAGSHVLRILDLAGASTTIQIDGAVDAAVEAIRLTPA